MQLIKDFAKAPKRIKGFKLIGFESDYSGPIYVYQDKQGRQIGVGIGEHHNLALAYFHQDFCGDRIAALRPFFLAALWDGIDCPHFEDHEALPGYFICNLDPAKPFKMQLEWTRHWYKSVRDKCGNCPNRNGGQ